MAEQRDWLDKHEKLVAFILLGAALFALAVMVYVKPPSSIESNGAALAILNTIVGALTLAFGGSANALFKITDSEKKSIGQAAANAVADNNSNAEPTRTEIVNKEPIEVTDKGPAEGPAEPPMFQEDK